MRVNRLTSVDYSNINTNKDRVLMQKSRMLENPSFGSAATLTNQAVVDEFIAAANTDKQRKRDMVVDPLGALSGKFRDLVGMFVPKNQEKARDLQSAIDYYYGTGSNNKY